MSNVFIIDNAQAKKNTGSVLAYASVLPTSTYTGENADPDFPFANALDFRDNTKYSPLIESGSVQIEFIQQQVTLINYFAFAIHNANDASLSGTFEVDSGGGYEIVSEFVGTENNKPFLEYFGDLSSQKQRLTLTFTSKIYIGSINVGKAISFNSCPAKGFQPAKTASLDSVEQFTTEGNNFIVGRRLTRGFQTKASFSYVSFEDSLDDWYEDYMNHVLDSKTLYFKWNSAKLDTTYGLQNPSTLAKPTYETSYHATIALEINGYA